MKKALVVVALAVLIAPVRLRAEACITAECHAGFKKLEYLHAAARQDCLTCHVKTAEHKFKPVAKAGLCERCHAEKKAGLIVHEAMNARPCWECHNWHGASNKALLKTDRQDTLCFECHDKGPLNRKVVHGPMASGNCSLCHEPHASNAPKLLKSSPNQLCLRCHTDKNFSGAGMHKHTPLEKGCGGCHDAHASDYPYQLLAPADQLCQRCHGDLMKKAEAAPFKHASAVSGKKCANCHDAHGSVFAHNLKQAQLALCLGCHDKPIRGTDGKDYNIKQIIAKNPVKHGPVAEGDCAQCHNPHGSEYYKMLNRPFPETFYTPFSEEKYGLCFQCHELSLVRDPQTTTLTNFRNGSVNLHYLHINREKGRTCRACHEIHASDLPNHLRRETPFGGWDIPIDFVKTARGGSCAPGCHRAVTYNRAP